MPSHPTKYPASFIARIEALHWHEGLNAAAIATVLNTPLKTVQRIMEQQAIFTPRYKGYRVPKKEDVNWIFEDERNARV